MLITRQQATKYYSVLGLKILSEDRMPTTLTVFQFSFHVNLTSELIHYYKNDFQEHYLRCFRQCLAFCGRIKICCLITATIYNYCLKFFFYAEFHSRLFFVFCFKLFFTIAKDLAQGNSVKPNIALPFSQDLQHSVYDLQGHIIFKYTRCFREDFLFDNIYIYDMN